MFAQWSTDDSEEDFDNCSNDSEMYETYDSAIDIQAVDRPRTSWDGATASQNDWLDTHLYINALRVTK